MQRNYCFELSGGPERTELQQIWMYYKEKIMKNLADLNTFETSMSPRD